MTSLALFLTTAIDMQFSMWWNLAHLFKNNPRFPPISLIIIYDHLWHAECHLWLMEPCRDYGMILSTACHDSWIHLGRIMGGEPWVVNLRWQSSLWLHFLYEKKPGYLLALQKVCFTIFLRRLVALWDNISLMILLPNAISKAVFRLDLRYQGSTFCTLFPYLLWSSSTNASAHLMGLAVDRALSTKHPTWPHGKTWDKIIKQISICLTMFHFLQVIPNFFVFKFNNGTCEMRSKFVLLLTLYQLLVPAFYGTVMFSVTILIATITFICQLRKKKED